MSDFEPGPSAEETVELPQQGARFRDPVRFGYVPVETARKGRDPENPGFRNHYPVINLPT